MRQLQYDQAHTAGAGFGIDDAHMDIRIGFPQFGSHHFRQTAAAGEYGREGHVNKILPGCGIFFKGIRHDIRRHLGRLGYRALFHGTAYIQIVDIHLVKIFFFAQPDAQRHHVHVIGGKIMRIQIADTVCDDFNHKTHTSLGLSV